MNVVIIVGTRPEIIKCASVIKALNNPVIIHTGQHYAERLSSIFFTELGLPAPNINLNIGSHMQHIQIAKIARGLDQHLKNLSPDVVIVQGDTNSTLAGTLAANKLGIPVAHIESGLRSYDRTMSEEVNRLIIDHTATKLFAPTHQASVNLNKENLKSIVTGNTSIDALVQYAPKAKAPPKFGKDKVLVTLHRSFNVDNPVRFEAIIYKIAQSIKDLEAVISLHPRLKYKIKWPPNFKAVPPLSYLEIIWAMKHAPLIITDSGGIQEEACYLKVPCITLRPNTERPETISIGANVLSNKENLPDNIEKMLFSNRKWACPYGNGTAYKTIISKLG